MKLLVNALSGIGDALMFSPALKALKCNLSDLQIDFLVMYKSVGELYENNPYISNIYFIDLLNQPKLKSLKEISDLRKNKYDYSINIYPSNRYEYKTFFSKNGKQIVTINEIYVINNKTIDDITKKLKIYGMFS